MGSRAVTTTKFSYLTISLYFLRHNPFLRSPYPPDFIYNCSAMFVHKQNWAKGSLDSEQFVLQFDFAKQSEKQAVEAKESNKK